MTDTEAITQSLMHFARWHPRVFPEDITPPGGQVPLFLGPCCYCGAGYVPHLPHPCPSCGAELRKVAVWPLWVQGSRTFRLWWRWMVFKRAFWESVPKTARLMVDLSVNMAQIQAKRR